ncbi:hypothetical protein [Secundilactobacillus similis]|uniref:hypothetical protein n=1 Tax=Secundilactobacillus similis TaxID=414682 RepID=UPI000A780367|nr:hypothetical protein [Secundilactobacillus similis]
MSADKLPLGVQFQAAKGQDRLLLAMGKLFEDQGQLKMRDTQNQTGTSDNGTPNTDATTSTTQLRHQIQRLNNQHKNQSRHLLSQQPK